MAYHHSVAPTSVKLSVDLILKEMGYDKVEPAEGLKESVSTLFDEAMKTAQPSCLFEIFDGEVAGETVVLTNGTCFNVGGKLAKLLTGSKRFAVFTATAGEQYQKLIRGLNQEGDILNCFIADVMGSCLVEATGNYMETLLEEVIAPLKHTHRFSPGYCGWSIMEQKQLFSLLGGTPCDIHLSEVCLMTPEKSISGIIGIGEQVNEHLYGCQFCELETCYKRKKRKAGVNENVSSGNG